MRENTFLCTWMAVGFQGYFGEQITRFSCGSELFCFPYQHAQAEGLRVGFWQLSASSRSTTSCAVTAIRHVWSVVGEKGDSRRRKAETSKCLLLLSSRKDLSSLASKIINPCWEDHSRWRVALHCPLPQVHRQNSWFCLFCAGEVS